MKVHYLKVCPFQVGPLQIGADHLDSKHLSPLQLTGCIHIYLIEAKQNVVMSSLLVT